MAQVWRRATSFLPRRRDRGEGRRRPGLRKIGAWILALAVVGLTVGGLLQLRIDTGIDSFVPSGDPQIQALDEKAQSFGGDPLVVLLEAQDPRQLLLDPTVFTKLLSLEGGISHLPGVASVYGPATAVNQVAISAQNLLSQISGHRDGVRSAAEAQARATGVDPTAAGNQAVAEFDARYAALLVRALPAGLPTTRNPQFLNSVVYDGQTGEPRPQWKAVVPTRNTVSILVRPKADLDQADTATLVDSVRRMVAQAGLPATRTDVSGVPAITAALSGRARSEFPMLGVVALGAVGVLYLLAPWTRRRWSRLRPLAVALGGTALVLAGFGWLGQPLSLGVVAFLPILLGIGSDFPLYLAQPAHRRRVLTGALAGAAGFASLALSPLPFVRELGIALALGIAVIVGVALLARRQLDVVEPSPSPRWDLFDRPEPRPWKIRGPVLAVAVIVAALGWVALPRLPIEAQPEQLARGLPALDETEHVEQVLGASGEVSIVLQGQDVLSPAALSWNRQAEDIIDRSFSDSVRPITTVSGLLAFLGPQPTPAEITAGAGLLPPYLASAVIRPDHHESLMVLGVQLQDLESQQVMLDRLRAALPPPPPGYTSNIVGLPVAASNSYQAISSGALEANLIAIALAGLVLLIGLRERADAGRALLSVALATGWVLAGAWLLSGSLSPLTVVVGSLTTATGCEFAVMLAEARRQRRPWLLRSVGLAAAAATAGYLVLALSGLAMLREFGLLLAGSVAMSFLAALTVIWVILPPRSSTHDPEPTIGTPEPDVTEDVRV